jgi:galactokinase
MPLKTLKMVELSSEQREILAQTSDNARKALFLEFFEKLAGSKPDHLAKAGGRVNLIGEHVDYPDIQFEGEQAVHLYSMGGSVQNSYLVVLKKRNDQTLRLWHLNAQEGLECTVSDLPSLEAQSVIERDQRMAMSKRCVPVWAFHSLGALMEHHQLSALGGYDILLTSNVPHGAGMSNSAANCVALALAFNAAVPALKLLKPLDIVAFARRAENSKFAGGHCGWLDQLLIVCSQENKLTRIDYAGNLTDHFESVLPKTWQFAALNTNVPHVLAESEYGDRVNELKLGIQMLRKHSGLQHLGSPTLSLSTYNRLLQKLSGPEVHIPVQDQGIEWDDKTCADMIAKCLGAYQVPKLFRHEGLSSQQSCAVLLKRMRHQKSSALIVAAAGLAASRGEAETFGELLNAEGRSLRMSGDFQITGDNGAQDALLDCGFESAKALGLVVYGRMLGGGGGGNVLFMADRQNEQRYQQWVSDTQARYETWTSKAFKESKVVATLIEPCLSAGAKLLF